MCIVTLGIFWLKSSHQHYYTHPWRFFTGYTLEHIYVFISCFSTHLLSILFPLHISVFSAWFRLSHTLYLARAYLWCLWYHPPTSTNSLCLPYTPIGFLPRWYNWSLVPSKSMVKDFLGQHLTPPVFPPVPSPWPCQLSDTMLPQSKKSS